MKHNGALVAWYRQEKNKCSRSKPVPWSQAHKRSTNLLQATMSKIT